MRYAYHFEFCERPEMPERLRGDLFLSLAWVQKSVGLSRVLARVAPRLIAECGARRVIELGSGSGDGLAGLAAALTPGEGRDFELVATDLFPHSEIWQKKFGSFSQVRWSRAAVGFGDFDRVLPPDELAGSVLLLSAAFHHLAPADARSFLERAAGAGAHVLVIEPLGRSLAGVVLGALAFVPSLAFPVAGRGLSVRERLRAALFHWLLPIIPFCLSHDGVVSAFRQRTREDWGSLAAGLGYEIVARENLGVLGNFSAVLLKLPPPSAKRHHDS